MTTRTTWEEHWMTQVYAVAARSHDPSTHVGCVIVSPTNLMRVTGYNGLPPGMDPKHYPELLESPTKYSWMLHAEENAVAIAAEQGIALSGCVAYVNLMPCMPCARRLVRAGISRIVYHKQYQDAYEKAKPGNRFAEDFACISNLCMATNRELHAYDGGIRPVTPFLNGIDLGDQFHRNASFIA